MKKLFWIMHCIFLLVFIYPKGAFAASKPNISMIYGGVHKNTMIVFFNFKTPKGIKTYWQTPGFGGISPEFSFKKHDNLSNIKVTYATPHIYRQSGLTNYTLNENDYIAISFQPINPELPVKLEGSLLYGYCDTLCKSDTFNFSQSFEVNKPSNDALIAQFFNAVPQEINPQSMISLNDFSVKYNKNQNLLISFNLEGVQYIDVDNFVYYIDTDFEIKTPIIRKTKFNKHQISLDLYDIYENPQMLTLIFPNNDGKSVIFKKNLVK